MPRQGFRSPQARRHDRTLTGGTAGEVRATAGLSVAGGGHPGLRIGDIGLHHPPQLDRDVEAFLELGVPVYYLREDAEERGIRETKLVDGIKPVGRSELPSILEEYDQVWHW